MDTLKGTILEGATTVPEGWSEVAKAAEADREKMISETENTARYELSIMEAVLERSDSVPQIFRFYDLLKAILDRHEATIQTRWQSKNKAQRRAIILKAWGTNTAQSHRPDWECVTKGRGHVTYEDVKAMIWPQINQENLTNSRSMLLFLASRGRNHPADLRLQISEL